MTALLLGLVGLAAAGTWSEQPIDPRNLVDGTAFTVPKKHWRLGLVNVDYGLLTNTSVGTSAPLWAVGIANARMKVTAIQTPKFDASIQGSWMRVGLPDFDGHVTVTPVAITGSWTPHPRWGLHFGPAWTLASVQGSVRAADIGQGIAAVTGADISADLIAALGQRGGVYGGANLSLLRNHAQIEYRMNRRDSLILRSDTYVALSGLVAAGAAVESGEAEVQAGASARLSMPLTESLPSINTLSWQLSWRRFHVRLGVPLPIGNYFGWLQAVDLYWVLGPSRRAERSTEASEG